MALIGNKFYNEVLLGTKEYKKSLCKQKVGGTCITSSTIPGYKNGREGDKVMYNFEHGAKFMLLMMCLKGTDIKVRRKFIISQIHCLAQILKPNF